MIAEGIVLSIRGSFKLEGQLYPRSLSRSLAERAEMSGVMFELFEEASRRSMSRILGGGLDEKSSARDCR